MADYDSDDALIKLTIMTVLMQHGRDLQNPGEGFIETAEIIFKWIKS